MASTPAPALKGCPGWAKRFQGAPESIGLYSAQHQERGYQMVKRIASVVAAVLLLATVAAGVSTVAQSAPAGATTPTWTVPTSVNHTCTADVTSTLEGDIAYLSYLYPSGVEIDLQPSGCYLVSTLDLHNESNITISGGGSATIEQSAQTTGVTAPILELVQDTNLGFAGVTFQGGYNPTLGNGGENYEGAYGTEFEADSGIGFLWDHWNNIQGDFMAFMPPYDTSPATGALNTNITVASSTFTNAGYHGLTVESVGCPTFPSSCNGLTVENSTFTNIGVDAMDFEYDNYPTCLSGGTTPIWAAENNVTIENNTWTNWNNDWFASVQGQVTPDSCDSNVNGGVSEQNLTLTGNTLKADSPLFEVVGSPQGSVPSQDLNANWTIEDNAFSSGYYATGYRGAGTPTSQLYFIAGIDLAGNTFPQCTSACTPNQYEIDWVWLTGTAAITSNNFNGAEGVQQPQAYYTGPTPTMCGNTWGSGGSSNDGTC